MTSQPPFHIRIVPDLPTSPVGEPAPDPGVAPSDRVGPDDPAREAIRASLGRNVAKLARHEEGARAGTPDSLRRLRIAARRLRSDLTTFRPLLDPEWAKALSQELGTLARSVGAARDREVTLARLERDIDVLPAGAPREMTYAYLRSVGAAELEQARAVAVGRLDSDGTAALIAAMRTAADDPRTNAIADQPCRRALPPLVAVTYRRLAKSARHLHLAAPGTEVHAEADDAWHDARLLAKKARYAADACVPVFGAPSAELAARLTDVTRCLGEHQDAAIAAAAAVELGLRPGCPAPAALGLGLLHGVQREAVLAARAIFVDLWPEVAPYAAAHERLSRPHAL